MKSLPPMAHVQCCPLGEYIHSLNMAHNNLMHAFSITGDEVEAWACKHHPGDVLPYPHLFHLRQVQSTTTASYTTPTVTHHPTFPQ